MDILSEIERIFAKRNWTLGLAESCTGGLLSSEITRRAGASKFFLGAIVSYALSVKHEVLGIPRDLLNKNDGVSESVALEMARGARLRLKSTWALAITGYAGPTGGNVDKPVGTVCIAVSGDHFERAETHHFQGDRRQVQWASTHCALSLLLETVTENS